MMNRGRRNREPKSKTAPRTLTEILDQADELADHFEHHFKPTSVTDVAQNHGTGKEESQ